MLGNMYRASRQSINQRPRTPPSERKGSVAAKHDKCEALFDFLGASKEDLPFKKGETLSIVSMTEDPNWWLVKNSKGRTGMIPANYVVSLFAALLHSICIIGSAHRRPSHSCAAQPGGCDCVWDYMTDQ